MLSETLGALYERRQEREEIDPRMLEHGGFLTAHVFRPRFAMSGSYFLAYPGTYVSSETGGLVQTVVPSGTNFETGILVYIDKVTNLEDLSVAYTSNTPGQVSVLGHGRFINTIIVQFPESADQMPAQWLKDALEGLEKLHELEPNWDSYGAVRITDASIQRARALLFSLSKELSETYGHEIAPDAVLPLPNGGIQLEWRRAQADFEVEVSPSAVVAYLLVRRWGRQRSFVERHGVSDSAVSALMRDVIGS